MDEEEELWERLLHDERHAPPELVARVSSERQEIADDSDITPVEAFNRGFKTGFEVAMEHVKDVWDTYEAAHPEMFEADEGKS
jgi:hypothetical protein